MATIRLNTRINAPIERVFDLARSIDLHKLSTKGTNEEAIGGRTTGLIEMGETVTWRAKHFGIYQKLTVEVIGFKSLEMFEDIMIEGTFKEMKHIHSFKKENYGTMMTDEFKFQSPFGFIGKMVDKLFLKNYMTQFLIKKNRELKAVAEGENWQKVLLIT